jgi:hypothetical protein
MQRTRAGLIGPARSNLNQGGFIMTWRELVRPQLTEAEAKERERFVRAAKCAAEDEGEQTRMALRDQPERSFKKGGKLYYAFTEDDFVAWIKETVEDALTPPEDGHLPMEGYLS